MRPPRRAILAPCLHAGLVKSAANRIVAKVDQLMALCDQLKARLNQARKVNEQLACALIEQAVA